MRARIKTWKKCMWASDALYRLIFAIAYKNKGSREGRGEALEEWGGSRFIALVPLLNPS